MEVIMKNLHLSLCIVLLAFFQVALFQFDANSVEMSKFQQHEQPNKEMNYKHLQEVQNGKKLMSVNDIAIPKKPSEKIKKPVIWHPKVKGVDLGG